MNTPYKCHSDAKLVVYKLKIFCSTEQQKQQLDFTEVVTQHTALLGTQGKL